MMVSEPKKMDLESENLVDDRIQHIKELFPEVITEGIPRERERE